jgi:hypothetical protein
MRKIKQIYGNVNMISAPDYMDDEENFVKNDSYAVFEKQLNSQLKLSFQINTSRIEQPYGMSLYIGDSAYSKDNLDFVKNPEKYMDVNVEDKQPIVDFAQDTILKAIRGY